MLVFLALLATGVAAVLLAPSALADSTTLSLCAPLPDPPCVVFVKRNVLDIPQRVPALGPA
jgi:hypothetical protein